MIGDCIKVEKKGNRFKELESTHRECGELV